MENKTLFGELDGFLRNTELDDEGLKIAAKLLYSVGDGAIFPTNREFSKYMTPPEDYTTYKDLCKSYENTSKRLTHAILHKDDFKIGDKFIVDICDLGGFIVTVQKVNRFDVTFMFDDCIIKQQWFTDTRFRLDNWLDQVLKQDFPYVVEKQMTWIGLPSYGMIFGHDDYYKRFEPDSDSQFELMKDVRNRIGVYKNAICWWWLSNKYKERSTDFACAPLWHCEQCARFDYLVWGSSGFHS